MSVATECAPEVFIPERARAARITPVSPVRLGPGGTPAELAPVVDLAERRRSRSEAVSVPVPLRLTRRGMAVLSLVAAAVALLMLFLAHGAARPDGTPAPSRAVAGVVTVRAGDPLWSIATRVAPDRDPRAVVAQLRRANSLSDVSLTPGQTLKVG